MQSSVLELWERSTIRVMLGSKLELLAGKEFESFWQDLMCLRYPDFLDVRTHGNLGDQGADGLLLGVGRLYACYAPEVFSGTETRAKIRGDLAKALEKRPGQFDTFVFVHSDRRGGMHPEVSQGLAKARTDHPDLAFVNFGRRRFYDELCRLERWQIEDLLGPFPAQPLVTGVGLEDVLPLLDHLAQDRRPQRELSAIPTPDVRKMEHNEFSPDVMHDMRTALPYIPVVKRYYDNRLDPQERDEVAAGFRARYLDLAAVCNDPDEILYELECHILGNESAPRAKRLNAMVVLMYFFGECDIFKMPPAVPGPRVPR